MKNGGVDIEDNKVKQYVRYQKGYRYIKVPNHPFANTNGFVAEHRIVVEQYLLDDSNSIIVDGIRYLSRNYAIHHIDFNRLNNNPENLLIMTVGEHIGMHKKLYDKEYFSHYCKMFNLNESVVKKTRVDFKAGYYKKYK